MLVVFCSHGEVHYSLGHLVHSCPTKPMFMYLYNVLVYKYKKTATREHKPVSCASTKLREMMRTVAERASDIKRFCQNTD